MGNLQPNLVLEAGSAERSEQVTQDLIPSGETSEDGDGTTSVGSLFHGLTVLMVETGWFGVFNIHPEPLPSACAVFQWEDHGSLSLTHWEVARRLLQSLL